MQTALETLAHTTSQALIKCKRRLVTAESCTGGGLSYFLTSVPGSSAYFDRGFVTYSNEAKMNMLGVNKNTLDHYGAVSKETAIEMAEGAIQQSQADISVAITGIAGPDGAQPGKPVGTVWLAIAGKGLATQAVLHHFSGDRQAVRNKSIEETMTLLLTVLS